MPSLQPLSTYRVTGHDGEMLADPSGEWVHVDDVRTLLATQPTASNAGERERFEEWYFDKFTMPVRKSSQGTNAGGTYYSYRADDELFEAWCAALSNLPPQAGQKPVGYVVHDKTRDMSAERAFHGLRIDSAFEVEPYNPECVTPVFANAQPEQVAQDSLTLDDAAKLETAIEQFGECGETSVDYEDLMRFANMGLLECVHFNVPPSADDAIRAARARGEGGCNG